MKFVYPAQHPGLSEELTHLCGRARQDQVPADVAAMPPPDRLKAILWEGGIRGFPPYGATEPVVSFTESRAEGLAYLIREKSWAPWGIVLDRDSVFQAGGGPVWYVRGDRWQDLWGQGPGWVKSWAVKLQPGEAEWLHEREWRVPVPYLAISQPQVRAVVVGNPNWSPGTRTVVGLNDLTGRPGLREEPPPLTYSAPRWCWNAAESRFYVLPPWPGYPHPS